LHDDTARPLVKPANFAASGLAAFMTLFSRAAAAAENFLGLPAHFLLAQSAVALGVNFIVKAA
jgi:hypothetical protein